MILIKFLYVFAKGGGGAPYKNTKGYIWWLI